MTMGMDTSQGETINDTVANDTLNGFGGNDILRFTLGGDDRADGGSESDTLEIDWSRFNQAITTPVQWNGDQSYAVTYQGAANPALLRVATTNIEHVRITASTGPHDDMITTGGGDDVVSAGGGNDRVDVGSGTDRADGGDGFDTIHADMGSATFDIVWDLRERSYSGPAGSAFANFEAFGAVASGSGNDRFVTGDWSANDSIVSGAGNDIAAFFSGLDDYSGGPGIDTMILDWSLVGGSINTLGIGLASGSLSGGYTSAGASVSFSGVENIQVFAANGEFADVIRTGFGNDIVFAEGGDDLVDTGSGIDVAHGGDGFDIISADLSAATVPIYWSLPGNSFSGPAGAGFTGFEAFRILRTGSGSDSIATGTAQTNEVIHLGAGDDYVRLLDGADQVYGGDGIDTLVVDWSNLSRAVVTGFAPVSQGPGQGYKGSFDGQGNNFFLRADYWNFENFEVWTSTVAAYSDSIVTGGGNDVVRTFDGNDTIDTGAGHDMLLGGGGDDVMKGGSGNDVYLVDSLGDSVVELANDGFDEVRTGLGSRTDFSRMYVLPAHVELFTGESPHGQGVYGNAFDNEMNMGAGADLVVLQDGGNDKVAGGGGDDFLYYGGALTNGDSNNGGAGFDGVGLLGSYTIAFDADDLVSIEKLALYGSGVVQAPNAYNVVMHDANVAAGTQMMVVAQSLAAGEKLSFNGSAELDGSFNVRGGKGDDAITGGAKADRLYGNMGADMLRGGAGKDEFEYRSTAESTAGAADTILDFARGDKINLSGIDADGDAANGDSKFSWIGSNAFTGAAGQLRATLHQKLADTWVVEADVNGDGAADLTLYLVAASGFVPERGDFWL